MRSLLAVCLKAGEIWRRGRGGGGGGEEREGGERKKERKEEREREEGRGDYKFISTSMSRVLITFPSLPVVSPVEFEDHSQSETKQIFHHNCHSNQGKEFSTTNC